jgi:mRNA-degrading endonuclease RelE of RelBE toxin-antitoxin system
MQRRVEEALRILEGQEPPFLGQNVRPLLGNLGGDYRIRVGDYRILFNPDFEANVIYIFAILPRGRAY